MLEAEQKIRDLEVEEQHRVATHPTGKKRNRCLHVWFIHGELFIAL